MRFHDPIRKVLSNGCTLIAQQVKGAPLISLYGFIKGGMLYEKPEKVGRINLMAQTLRRGTETKTAQDIDETLERRGADLGFGLGHEGISFHLTCLPQDYKDCSSLLTEILRFPSFPEEEIEKQKLRNVNALKDALTRPEEVSYRRFLSLAYPPSHPFHFTPDGNPESVANISREDVFQAYQEVVDPSRSIFAIVGDMEPQKLIDTFVELISDWEQKGENFRDFPTASLPEIALREQVNLPDKLQAWVTMGHKGIRRNDERFYAANIATTILGAGWGRLFTQIRDNQGLAYAVWAALQAGLAEGPFIVRMGVNPKDIDQAIESALFELEKIRNEPPSEDEVADAKNYLLGRLTLSMETTSGIASMLVSCELYGLGLDYPQRAKSLYEPIKPEKVMEVAFEVIHPECSVISVAGP